MSYIKQADSGGGGDISGSGAANQIAFFNGTKTITSDSDFTVNATTGRITVTGGLDMPTGSAAAPALAISGDTDTGVFSAGANQIGFAVSGSEGLGVGANKEVVVGGSPGNANQVLTSQGSGSAAAWKDAAGGGAAAVQVDDGIINTSYTRFMLTRTVYWGQVGTGSGNLTDQDDPILRPFISPASGTITEFGVQSTTADATQTTKARIAIYTDSSGAPLTKLGEVDIPLTTTGAAYITSGLPVVTLAKGTQYWWGYCRSNGTNSLGVKVTSNSQVNWVGPSTAVGSTLNAQSTLKLLSSANTMPSTITQSNLAPTFTAPVLCTLKF